MIATTAFIASTLAYALQPLPRPIPQQAMALPGLGPDETVMIFPDLASQFLRPRIPAMAALLVTTWFAVLVHALRQLIGPWRRSIPRERGQPQLEHGLLIIGLVAGAVWPWLLADQPGGAFLLGALMLAGVLGEAMEAAQGTRRLPPSNSLSFAAGWSTLAGSALLATLLQAQFGTSERIAAVLGIIIAALVAVSVQLRLGHTIAYGIAVIWGMIGLAAGAVATQASLSMMAVLAIAIIAVAMVRVTT